MPSLRTVFKVVGFVLMAAALVFVGMQVAQYVQDLRAAATRPQTWFAVVAGAVLYAALSLLLSGAWQTILARAGAGAPVSLRTCYEVYGRSQIAKYVPGNVFHFVGRQLLGRSAGWAQGAIALSSVVETLLMGLRLVELRVLRQAAEMPFPEMGRLVATGFEKFRDCHFLGWQVHLMLGWTVAVHAR